MELQRIMGNFSVRIQLEQHDTSWFQVWDQKILFILLLRRTQILESYKMLICYCIDGTCQISGSMTLVKTLDIAFQYPRIQYISIFLVSWGLQAKHSIRIGLFPLWVYINKIANVGIFSFSYICFTKAWPKQSVHWHK